MPPESEWIVEAQNRAVEKKTHVSFPQLKYPSLRDSGLKDPVQWLEGKALDDGAEGLWRVHDKLYDLTSFMKKHPGGEEWIALTKGTDITEAFECHHIGPSAENMLNKFFVRDAKTGRNSPFTFHEDGFYRTFKIAVYDELKKIPKDASKSADRIADGLFLSLLCSTFLASWTADNWTAKFWYLYASINLALFTVICHNYIHKKSNWRMYLFSLSMRSYRDIRVSHVLSHHLYTNTLMDLELNYLEPILFYTPRQNKPLHAKLGFISQLFFFHFVFLLSFTKRIAAIFYHKGFFSRQTHWHDLICLALPAWMYITSGATLWHVVETWLWINCTVNAAHHHPDAIKDGDQPVSETPDWGIHQVEALLDRRDITSNVFSVLTFFGDHALHHMFPTLDHSILKHLHPVFIEHCYKYQANYKVSTQIKMVLGQIKETMRTEFRTK